MTKSNRLVTTKDKIVKLKTKTAMSYNMRSQLARELEAQYKGHQGTGRDNELKVANIIRSLFDVEDAWVAAPGSVLDTAYKVDVVVELPQLDVSVCLQVKTTQEQAAQYNTMYCSGINVEGRLYSAPTCIVAMSVLSVVQQLLRTDLASYAKDGLVDAVRMVRQLKGKTVPCAVVQPKTKFFLQKLGVQIKGNNLVFPK